MRSATRSVAVACRSGNSRAEAAAEHHRHDVVVGDLRGLDGTHGLAVAQDRHPVGDPPDLVHAVRDVEHEPALRRVSPGHAEEPVHVSGHERGRGLVEDEDVRLARQCLGDLHQLLVGDGQHPDRSVRAAAPAGRGAASSSRVRVSMPRREMVAAGVSGSAPNQMFSATVRSGIERELLEHGRDAGTPRVARASGAR